MQRDINMSTAIQINDILPKQQYIATEGQTLFSFNFPILADSDLQVFRTPSGQEPDDAAQALTLNSDYTVTGVGVETGGSITMLIAITINDRITLQRAMPYDRISSYTGGLLFNPDNLDNDFNSIILMMQQIHAYYEKRFVHYENTILDDTANLRLPTLADGQFWKKNSGGIVAATLEENPDWSTLRTELASQAVGTDGSRIIGYQDAIIGSATLHNAIQAYIATYAVDSGSANTILFTIDNFIGYREGQRFYVKIAADNTAPVTVNISNAGVRGLKLQDGGDLPTKTLLSNMIAEIVNQGSYFVLMNPFESYSDFETGDCIFSTRTSKVGWILVDDGTIGSPDSTASTLKSLACHDLFIHLWNTYSNSLAPVTEGRGANAEADWLANKKIQILTIVGRALAASGSGAGLTVRTPASIFGEQTHALTSAENAAHTHSLPSDPPGILGFSNAPTHDVGVGAGQSAFFGNTTGSSGSGTAHNIVQPTVWLPVFMKL
jgi:hypothetical protein